MRSSVAIIADQPLQEVVCHIARVGGFYCESYDSYRWPETEVALFQNVIFILHGINCDHGFDGLKRLRNGAGFRGGLIFASYVPRERAIGLQGGEVIDTPGCAYIQMPFLVDEMLRLMAREVELTAKEMAQVAKRIGARRLAQNAGSIRHDYENKMALALAHLRELEKLSYFSQLDLKKVERAIAALRLHLTLEKYEAFRADACSLFEAADEWRGSAREDISSVLVSHWRESEAWFQMNHSMHQNLESQLPSIFKQAKQMQASIRNVMTLMASIKKEALQETQHA